MGRKRLALTPGSPGNHFTELKRSKIDANWELSIAFENGDLR